MDNLGGFMIINNDKKNELTQAITSIAQKQIQKGNVDGIYISAYTDTERNNQPQVTVTSVINKITEDWEDERNYRYSDIYTQVRNIRINTDCNEIWNYAPIMMNRREFVLGQELKNGYIIYDTNGELQKYKEVYDQDQYLTLYRNRIEISSRFLSKIRQSILNRKNVAIQESMTTHIVNPYRVTAWDIIEYIKSLLGRYEFETNPVYSPREYIIYDEKNRERFEEYFKKKQENQIKYHVSLVAMMKMHEPDQNNVSTMEREKFYQACIAFLENQIPHINVKKYLDEEEVERYDKIFEKAKVKVKE